MPLKIRALKMGYPVYFKLQATLFYKRFRTSMTKHKQQSTKFEIKEQIQYGGRFVMLLHYVK